MADQPSSQSERHLRCLVGLHRWTRVPKHIVRAAEDAGVRSLPLWYVGRTAHKWCTRCEKEAAAHSSAYASEANGTDGRTGGVRVKRLPEEDR